MCSGARAYQELVLCAGTTPTRGHHYALWGMDGRLECALARLTPAARLAALSMRNELGQTPLMLASMMLSVPCCKVLRAAANTDDLRDIRGRTARDWARYARRVEYRHTRRTPDVLHLCTCA